MIPAETEWMQAMRRGDYQAAWAVSDLVAAARPAADSDNPALPYHRRWVWTGESFDGRDVLVRCYHGLGDTLHFARLLPLLRRRVAALTLEVQPALLPLLAAIPGPDRMRAFDPARPAARSAVDVKIPAARSPVDLEIPTARSPVDLEIPAARSAVDLEIMELFHALRVPPEHAPPPHLAIVAQPSPPGSIGLCWQAGDWDPARSIQAATLAPLLRGRPLVSLHPGPAPEGLAALNPQGCPAAIADTAALIAGLDLIITVDTMVAHLAGTLGRPTWLLLRHHADWRWMEARSDSPWYPSMRLFRQPSPGDWDGVAARLAAELARLPHQTV